MTPYQPPPNTSTPNAAAQQGAAVAQATSQPAANSAQTVLDQIAAIPQTLQQLALQQLSGYQFTNWPFSMLQSQFQDLLKYGLPTPTNDWFGIRENKLAFPASGISPLYNEGRQFLQAYFGVGLGNFGWGIGQQTAFGPGGTTAGVSGAWFPTPQFAGIHLGAVGGGLGGAHTAGAVSATAGEAGRVGMLSVPANWANPTAEATLVSAVSEETPANAGATAVPGNALLRGIPTGAVGRRSAGYGYTTKYGFRYSVLTRPPSAG